MIEGVEPSMYPDADLGSDRDEREPKPCLRRYKRHAWCLLPNGHSGDCDGITSAEMPEPFQDLGPKRRPKWG